MLVMLVSVVTLISWRHGVMLSLVLRRCHSLCIAVWYCCCCCCCCEWWCCWSGVIGCARWMHGVVVLQVHFDVCLSARQSIFWSHTRRRLSIPLMDAFSTQPVIPQPFTSSYSLDRCWHKQSWSHMTCSVVVPSASCGFDVGLVSWKAKVAVRCYLLFTVSSVITCKRFSCYLQLLWPHFASSNFPSAWCVNHVKYCRFIWHKIINNLAIIPDILSDTRQTLHLCYRVVI